MGEHALEGTWLVRPEGYCSPVRSSTLVLRTSRHPWGDEGGRHTTRELRHPACWYNVFSHVVASGRSGRGSVACASMVSSGAELEGGSVVLLVSYRVSERLKLVARGFSSSCRVISYPRTGFRDASH